SLRILCARRPRPRPAQARAQCFQFATGPLRRGPLRPAGGGGVVGGLAGGGKPRRVALVEQRCDLLGIELGRRWGGLLRRGRRLGVGLFFLLGLLGFVLGERVGGRVGPRLRFLFFGVPVGGAWFPAPPAARPRLLLPPFPPPSRSDPRPG